MIFEGTVLQEVTEFTYLGLRFDRAAKDDTMVEAVIKKSKVAWTALHKKILTHGWRQSATRLLLMDTLVRSHMVFGAPVWATRVIGRRGAGRTGVMGRLCALYRSA